MSRRTASRLICGADHIVSSVFAFSLILAASAFTISSIGWPAHAIAQEESLDGNTAVVTTFSGLKTLRDGTESVDQRGISVRLLDLSDFGVPANGNLVDAPLLHSVQAWDVGQVFAIEFDDAGPANIYVAASSTYGLFREPDNSDWVAGMWGTDGGPGTIYRLRADDEYRAEVFTDVGISGRENSGPGLGDLAYDKENRQLFVSDLETGMIHRLDIDTGDNLSVYDHGTQGRTAFFDVESGADQALAPVAFNPGSEANILNCGAGPEGNAAARFMEMPACWNFAPYQRRVWGLTVKHDRNGADRLYYSVWGSAAFGDPSWNEDDEDARNAVWSIGLKSDGSFDLNDIRREFFVPAFYYTRQDLADFGDGHAIANIEFLDDRVMLLGERGKHLGRKPDPTAEPANVVSAARAIRMIAGEDGRWTPEGRYDIGFGDRETQDPPHIRANGAGGLGLGYGYDDDGKADESRPGETFWTTGHRLCDGVFPCIGGSPTEPLVHGLQGLPIALISELNPVAAYVPYPVPGPATPPITLESSYFIAFGEADDGLLAGDVGDVKLLYPGKPEVADLFDLAVDKSGPLVCRLNGRCIFDIEVTNAGTVDYDGPIHLMDRIESGYTLVQATPDVWACEQNGDYVYCRQDDVHLEPGETIPLRLDFSVPGQTQLRSFENCVEIMWLGRPGRERIRMLQLELNRRGYGAGVADGVAGRRTAAAIRAAEAALGLPVTGRISEALLVALFGDDLLRSGDDNPRNDRDCVPVDIPGPVHEARISAFHRDHRSSFHNPNTSGPIETHDPALSNFHQRFRSSMHDGRTTRRIPTHRPAVSRFHDNWRSRFHNTRNSRHRTGLSSFHSRFRSSQHVRTTSRGRPVHNPVLSRFHRNNQSRFHSTANSRHRTGLSSFHARRKSSLHVRGTSRVRPAHKTILSRFHRSNQSRFHSTANSRHRTGLSSFHARKKSSLHVRGTSRVRPAHKTILSRFHRSNKSRFHSTANSRHRTGLSSFHARRKSSLHLRGTSRLRPAHNQVLSRFHRNNQSNLHLRATSRARPTHNQALSNFHANRGSNLHNRTTSRLRVQPKLPILPNLNDPPPIAPGTQ